MPLLPGKENIGKNIKELLSTKKHGKKKFKNKQAIAIALREAGVPKKGATL